MNQLDKQLDMLACGTSAAQPPEFPLALKTLLSRRRLSRRIRIGSAILCPLLVICTVIWWPRSPAPNIPVTTSTIVRADPANLPIGPAWQPPSIERALDRSKLDLSGF